MTREEISTYIDNAILFNDVVTDKEADIIGLKRLVGSVQIDNFYFKKDADNNIILMYCKPCYKEIEFGDAVDIIYSDAFSYNHVIEVIKGDSVKLVKGYGFSHCKNLKKVVFPHIVKVGYSCFRDCYSLTDVKMKPYRINGSAFYNCKSLTAFDFTNAEYIGKIAFRNTGIREVNAPNLQEMGVGVFSCCDLLKFNIPTGVKVQSYR